ncbi:MAG: DUF1015 domain-containing protein [Eubacteriales bacterium]|nr:DUF1015 domain-containing protein [Eubacteriales bacterium]
MKTEGNTSKKRAFGPTDIMLPKQGTNMQRWSVVACDQFTSEPEYWAETERIVGRAPSTLRMILPEVYLDGPEEEERLEDIRFYMKEYKEKELFQVYEESMIYVERTDSTGKLRAGIVGCVDLEQYDYHKGSRSLIRATEATVVERIPPRIRVRKNAPVELPHIMLLIDDKKKTVVEGCEKYKKEDCLLYDFDLMQGGGHLKGYLLEKEAREEVLLALDKMEETQRRIAQQVVADSPGAKPSVLLFAVGDGNHSLASAKEFYEQQKAEHPEKDFSRHPARYAMVELVNLHSPALEFEAIHRIVTGADVEDLMKNLIEALDLVVLEQGREPEKGEQSFIIVQQGREDRRVVVKKPTSKLTVGSLQNFLDAYQKRSGIKMDYIHGENAVRTLTKKEGSLGFLLPDMRKEELFLTVMADGALPRKTFSMGHAEDKRYYTECRKIRE